MHIIAIVNQKGGCGKTTTAINLAASLGQKGHRTLLVDADPQGHASLGLGGRRQDEPGLYEIFALDFPLAETIIPRISQGLDIIPATVSLAAVEYVLANMPERERQLSKYLHSVASIYDYVVIDCPPALGLLSINAIRAAQRVIVPVDMSLFAIDGIERLSETVDLVATKYDLNIELNILPTLVDRRTRLGRRLLLGIWERYQNKVLPVMIHHTVRLKESVCAGQSIVDFAPNSPAASDFSDLADELIMRNHTTLDTTQANISWLLSHVEPTESGPANIASFHKGRPAAENSNVQRVVLSFQNHQQRDIRIAGEFNEWIADKDIQTVTENDIIHKVFYVEPGDYQYRLIVDGKWRNDPTNPRQALSTLGIHNSLLHVTTNGTFNQSIGNH